MCLLPQMKMISFLDRDLSEVIEDDSQILRIVGGGICMVAYRVHSACSIPSACRPRHYREKVNSYPWRARSRNFDVRRSPSEAFYSEPCPISLKSRNR